MNCAEIEERLNAYADGELSPADRPGVDAHLGSCEECRRTLDAIRAQDLELGAAFAGPRLGSEALAGRVVEAFRGQAARPRARAWPVLAAAAAGFLVAFFLFRRAPDPRADDLARELAALRAGTPPDPPVKGGPPDSLSKEFLEVCSRLERSEKQRQELEARLASLPPLEPVKKPMARLAVATGPVEVRSASMAWGPIEVGGGLEVGMWVRTPGKSKCSFDYNDGTEIRVNENTEIRLERPRAVELVRGEIFTRVAPNPVRFEVRTEQAKVDAPAGTLNVSHSARDVKEAPARLTTVTVLEGSAVVGGRTVPPGFSCPVVDGEVQAPAPAQPPAVLSKWVHEILVLRGADTTELRQRVEDLLTKPGPLPEGEVRSLGDHAAVPLTRYVTSPASKKERERRRAAARILADVASSPSVPDFIALLRDDDPQVRVQAARGLQRLTGQTLGYDEKHWTGYGCVEHGGGADAWGAWLKKNEDTWTLPREKMK